ncbi:hypothetical protein FRAHR75_1640003 [Frankia sp. Hr75.2]|nr:hypothetical protein FRAHR75_1640003 [Frankia sp. Hr75.2]
MAGSRRLANDGRACSGAGRPGTPRSRLDPRTRPPGSISTAAPAPSVRLRRCDPLPGTPSAAAGQDVVRAYQRPGTSQPGTSSFTAARSLQARFVRLYLELLLRQTIQSTEFCREVDYHCIHRRFREIEDWSAATVWAS